jgi:hypothetical protein
VVCPLFLFSRTIVFNLNKRKQKRSMGSKSLNSAFPERHRLSTPTPKIQAVTRLTRQINDSDPIDHVTPLIFMTPLIFDPTPLIFDGWIFDGWIFDGWMVETPMVDDPDG